MTRSEEKKYRRSILSVGIMCMAIVIIGFLMMGCASGVMYHPNCADKTLYVVETLANRKPEIKTRIFIGPTTISQSGHAQSQALLNGKWVWVRSSEFGFEYDDEPEWFFKPDREVTLEWLKKFVINEHK